MINISYTKKILASFSYKVCNILMKFLPAIIILLISISIFSQQSETATVTLVRKKMQVQVGVEFKDIKIGDELPLNSTVKSEGMGYLEFEYKGASYRVGKNTKIILSDVINSSPETGITNSGGVRAKVDDPNDMPNVGSGKGLTNKKNSKNKKKPNQ
jgi:hypothetical protein